MPKVRTGGKRSIGTVRINNNINFSTGGLSQPTTAQQSAQQQQNPTTQTAQTQQQAQQQSPQPIQQQQNLPNTRSVSDLANMTDQQLASELIAAQTVDLPYHVAYVKDAAQNFIQQMGLNGMPTVLDDAAFDQYIKDNRISSSDVLARDVASATLNVGGSSFKMTASMVAQQERYDPINHIGGKVGGRAYGVGTYFDKGGYSNYNRHTGYTNDVTSYAVLNPKTTRSIDAGTLSRKIASYKASHPQTANAMNALVKKVGGLKSSNGDANLYAALMGYNVITHGSGGYVVVIDRSALVYRNSTY